MGEGAGRRQKESVSRVSKEYCVQADVQYEAEFLTVQSFWLSFLNLCVVKQRRGCVQMFVRQMEHQWSIKRNITFDMYKCNTSVWSNIFV